MEALKYSPDQMQIMEFLERERRPMTAKEINDRLEFGSPSEVMSMMDQLVRDGHARNLIGDRYESVRTGLPYMSVDPLALVTQAQSLLAEGRPAQELLPSLKVALRALSSDGLKYRQVTASRLEPGDIVIVHEFGRPTEKMVDRVDFDGRGMYNIVFDDGTNERVNAYAPIDIKAAVPPYQAVSPSSPADPAALAEALADGTLVKAVIENMTAKMMIPMSDIPDYGWLDGPLEVTLVNGESFEVTRLRRVPGVGGAIGMIVPERGGGEYRVDPGRIRSIDQKALSPVNPK